jgi:predicted dehydrogenase
METVGVGIVGSAFAASLHADAYRRCPYARVVAAASKAPEELRQFCQRFDIPHAYDDLGEMLARDDVQMVSICAPNFTHKELVLTALAAGKDVVCEKPLATTTEDARAMVKAAQAAGRKLFYAEDWVFAPALVRVTELIGEGAVGTVLYVKAKESHLGSHSIFAQRREYCGGGAMIHLGIHAVGFCLALLPDQVTEVWGAATGGGEANLVHREYTGEDWAVGLLTFAGGTRALVEGNYVTVGGLDDIVEVYASDGVIKVDLSQGSPLRVYSRPGFAYAVEKADTTTGWTRPAVDELRNLGYPDEIAHFVDCVRRDQPAKRGVRAEDGLRALEVVDAIYRSAEGKRAVLLPLS